MKIIDMHCDTISRICQERNRNNNCSLHKNSLQVDLLKMKSSDYLLQNFAIFIDLSETDCPYQTFQEQLAIFKEEITKNSNLITPVTCYSEIIANEKAEKMSALLTLEEGEVCGGDLDKLKEEIEDSYLFTNATGMGMKPREGQTYIPDLSFFRPDLIVTDIIYSPLETKMLKMAKEAGCKTMNGMGMLLFQGAAAFELWTGKEMPVEHMKEVLNIKYD